MSWIKLHHQLLDSKVFAHPTALKIWIWCLLRATWKLKHVSVKSGRGEKIIDLQPGEFIFGRITASEALDIPGTTAWRWMKELEQLGMISIKTDSQFSVITICNWATYQQVDESEWTANGQETDRKRTANETHSEHVRNTFGTRLDTNKSILDSKELIERKEENTNTGFCEKIEIQKEKQEIPETWQALERIKSIFPNRESLHLAERIWAETVETAELAAEIEKKAGDYAEYVRISGQKPFKLGKWLSGREWENDYIELSKAAENVAQARNGGKNGQSGAGVGWDSNKILEHLNKKGAVGSG